MNALRPFHGFAMHQLGRRAGLHVFHVLHRKLRRVAPDAGLSWLELRSLTLGQLLPHCADPTLDLAETMVRQAFARGDICVGALEDSELAGYVWLAQELAPHVDGIWVRVPPRAVYRYKAFVRPAYRGRGIAPALYRFADSVFLGSGCEDVVNCIATHNFSSVAASKSTGDRTLGYLGYWHWQRGRRFVGLCSPAVRRFGLRFFLS